MKLAMLLMGCSIIGMASVAATQQTAYVPPGTTVVTDPTTGSATYDDGVMSGTLTGFHIVIMQDFIDNDQTAPVLITPTPLGSTLTNLTFTVTPPESGTVDTAGEVPIFVPADDFVGVSTLTVTGSNRKDRTITQTFVIDVRQRPATGMIIDLGPPSDKPPEVSFNIPRGQEMVLTGDKTTPTGDTIRDWTWDTNPPQQELGVSFRGWILKLIKLCVLPVSMLDS